MKNGIKLGACDGLTSPEKTRSTTADAMMLAKSPFFVFYPREKERREREREREREKEREIGFRIAEYPEEM